MRNPRVKPVAPQRFSGRGQINICQVFKNYVYEPVIKPIENLSMSDVCGSIDMSKGAKTWLLLLPPSRAMSTLSFPSGVREIMATSWAFTVKTVIPPTLPKRSNRNPLRCNGFAGRSQKSNACQPLTM